MLEAISDAISDGARPGLRAFAAKALGEFIKYASRSRFT
jgi:hypothetical protein